jgi:hypothetical protein
MGEGAMKEMPNTEYRTPNAEMTSFGRPGVGLSDFGFRISDFDHTPC